MNGFLRCEGLWAGYGDVTVLRDLTLGLEEGTIEALLGPNGAGKTTFAAAMLGLISASEGRIYFDGTEITKSRTDVRVRLGVGLVQDGKRIFRQRTVLENLNLGARHLGKWARTGGLEEVYELFPVLLRMQERRAGELSGGQQQMLAIGQALMGRPRVLILDEPSAGLAPAVVDDVFDAILTLKTRGLSIILIEQLVERAMAVADHVTVLSQGRLVLSGTVAELSGNDALYGAYFGK